MFRKHNPSIEVLTNQKNCLNVFRNVKKRYWPFSDNLRRQGDIHNSNLSFPEQENDIVTETKKHRTSLKEVYFGK